VSAQVASQPATTPVTPAPTSRRVVWEASVANRPITRIEPADGTIVTTDDAGVAAIDAADGTVRWRQDTGGAGHVVVGRDVLASGGDALTAVDLGSGDQRWIADDVGPVQSLTALDRTILAVAGGGSASEIVAVDGTDGAHMWRTAAIGSDPGAPAVVAAGTDLAYVLHDTTLGAIDPARAAAGGTTPLNGVIWQHAIEAPWLVLAPVDRSVVVATEDGSVCRHSGDDGALLWCETVPGVEAAQPRLFTAGRFLLVATAEAVVALDLRSGAQEWSVSPGSPTNQVTVDSSWVAVGDHAGVRVLDAETGDTVLELPGPGAVTALALDGGRLYAGSEEGALTSMDLSAP
jgi:outer membrane protein assembly factor BamB